MSAILLYWKDNICYVRVNDNREAVVLDQGTRGDREGPFFFGTWTLDLYEN